jgi:membrane associated rhomboid family serine protease
LAFVTALRQLFAGGPVFVISESGFHLPRFARETIAWSAVTALTRTKAKRIDTLKIIWDPATTETLTIVGFYGRVARFARLTRNSCPLVLSHLDCDPDRLVAQCESYMEAARAAAHLRGEPPRILPSSALPAAFRLGTPWLTYALLALLAIVYVCELQFAVNANKDGAPSVLTLAYLGGTIGNRIWINGEWWRLFTAPFLHASVLHILMNSLVLWIAGTALEKLMGWRWTGAIFAASALSGSLGSVLINAPNIVGVGASGGITGLLAASFVTSFRLPVGALRTRLQVRAGQTIIPAVLPFLSSGNGPRIDYAAHVGGVLTGGLLSLVILQLWRRERSEPRFGNAAVAFALLFVLIAAGSIIPIIHLRQYGR